MKHSFLYLAIGLALSTATARATGPLVSFTNTTGAVLNNPPFTIGYEFEAMDPAVVTELGLFDDSQNGFGEAHVEGLYDSAGTLLASTTISAGTVDVLIGNCRYAPITPVVLTAGQVYFIGALFASGTDFAVGPRFTDATGFSTDPSISFLNASSAFGAALTAPTSLDTSVDPGFFGPNAIVDAVPEPSAARAVLGSAVVLVWWRFRARKAADQARA